MNTCVNCGHDWAQHYADHGAWRCRWDRGRMGARETCGCTELVNPPKQVLTTADPVQVLVPGPIVGFTEHTTTCMVDEIAGGSAPIATHDGQGNWYWRGADV